MPGFFLVVHSLLEDLGFLFSPTERNSRRVLVVHAHTHTKSCAIPPSEWIVLRALARTSTGACIYSLLARSATLGEDEAKCRFSPSAPPASRACARASSFHTSSFYLSLFFAFKGNHLLLLLPSRASPLDTLKATRRKEKGKEKKERESISRRRQSG